MKIGIIAVYHESTMITLNRENSNHLKIQEPFFQTIKLAILYIRRRDIILNQGKQLLEVSHLDQTSQYHRLANLVIKFPRKIERSLSYSTYFLYILRFFKSFLSNLGLTVYPQIRTFLLPALNINKLIIIITLQRKFKTLRNQDLGSHAVCVKRRQARSRASNINCCF